MSEILAACGFGSGILGAVGYVAGDMEIIFSGKGTGALFGSTMGAIIAYMLHSRNTLWNDEFYKIFFGEKHKNPVTVEVQGNRFEVSYAGHGYYAFKKIIPPTFEENLERGYAIAFIAFSTICALCLDWATVHMKAHCKRYWDESCDILSTTESSIGLAVISGLFFAVIYQTLFLKKNH